ncbi:MAG: hypothetical protein ACOYZ6_18605 [Chloroflexota bacterium]
MSKKLSSGCSGALGLFLSLPFLAMGGYILAVSLDVIHADPSFFKAPREVVAAGGMCFFLGGVWTVLKSISWAYGQDTPMVKWMSFFLVLTMMGIFSWLFLWTGFGPGERQFQSSTSIGPITASGPSNETFGRVFFGSFGILAALGTLYYAVTQSLKMLGIEKKSPVEGE